MTTNISLNARINVLGNRDWSASANSNNGKGLSGSYNLNGKGLSITSSTGNITNANGGNSVTVSTSGDGFRPDSYSLGTSLMDPASGTTADLHYNDVFSDEPSWDGNIRATDGAHSLSLDFGSNTDTKLGYETSGDGFSLAADTDGHGSLNINRDF